MTFPLSGLTSGKRKTSPHILLPYHSFRFYSIGKGSRRNQMKREPLLFISTYYTQSYFTISLECCRFYCASSDESKQQPVALDIIS